MLQDVKEGWNIEYACLKSKRTNLVLIFGSRNKKAQEAFASCAFLSVTSSELVTQSAALVIHDARGDENQQLVAVFIAST